MEKVSIYIPTRNRRRSLEKAVRSVLEQSYTDIETVIVDDASTDDSWRFIEEISASDNRVLAFRNESPGGAPKARNRAISAATGQFITGLDDDDFFHPDRTATFVAAWKLFADAGVTPAFLYSQDVATSSNRVDTSWKKPGFAEAHDLLIQNVVGNQVFAPKAHFIECGLFDEDMPAWQDLELYYRMLKRYGSGRLVDLHSYYIDLSPRTDRISADGTRVRKAFERMLTKHPEITGRRKQQLFLQLISPKYGIYPGLADWMRMVSWGFWPRGFARMFRRQIQARSI
ncbi:glycosyltransferase [Microvirga sp. 2YAF29]|uniref:glycosyltransferase n=1 Tax=Microvirga sp. 2YAF29 TaxID=3233031 RepID=UPI003F9C29B4